jgi:hypothetical protein
VLNARIEELLVQVTALMTENAELRSHGITLYGQLKRERARTRKVLVEAEEAVRRLIPPLPLVLTVPLGRWHHEALRGHPSILRHDTHLHGPSDSASTRPKVPCS